MSTEDSIEIVGIDIQQSDTIPDMCRYCLGSELELQSKLINPCACKNPVCLDCLRLHIDLNKKTHCEICNEPFELGSHFDSAPVNSYDSLPITSFMTNSIYHYNSLDSDHPDNSGDETVGGYCRNCIGENKSLCTAGVIVIIVLLLLHFAFNKKYNFFGLTH